MFRKRETYQLEVNEIKKAEVSKIDKTWQENRSNESLAHHARREAEFSTISSQLGSLNNMTDAMLSRAIMEIESEVLTPNQERDCLNRIFDGNYAHQLLESRSVDDFVAISRNSSKTLKITKLK